MNKLNHPLAKLFALAIFFSLLLLITTPYIDMIICLILVLIFYGFGKGIKKEVGFELNGFSFFKTILNSILTAVVGIGVIYGIGKPLIELFTGSSLDLSYYDVIRGNTTLYLNTLLIGILIGGFVEEILFRSFLLKQIQELIGGKAGAIIGLLISAAFFGFLHQYQGITGQLLIGLTGCYLGIIYLINQGRIWQNILTHAFINTISITLVYLGFF